MYLDKLFSEGIFRGFFYRLNCKQRNFIFDKHTNYMHIQVYVYLEIDKFF